MSVKREVVLDGYTNQAAAFKFERKQKKTHNDF